MSKPPLPMRRRVALALTALGFLLSALFTVAAIAVTEDYEHVLSNEILRGQAEDYSLRLSNHLPAQLPRTHRLSGYSRIDVPARYLRLPPGVSEDASTEGVHVGVFDTSAGRLWFVVDLSDIEALELRLRWLLAGIVLLGTLLAGIVGWYLAGAALKPLGRLAREVDALPVAPRITELRKHASADELGHLAAAIDDYQRRLVEADAHEQAFFADASHELRTPISIVQGAAEVMLDDAESETDPRRIDRLRRLERGVREMTDLTEMLLEVARRRPLQAEPLQAAAFLRDIAASLDADAAVEIDAPGTLHAPPRSAALLLRHAIGKLGWPASGEHLRLRFDGHVLVLETRAADATSTPPRSDAGGAGALATQLARRIGWRHAPSSPGCVRFELPAGAGGALT